MKTEEVLSMLREDLKVAEEALDRISDSSKEAGLEGLTVFDLDGKAIPVADALMKAWRLAFRVVCKLRDQR